MRLLLLRRFKLARRVLGQNEQGGPRGRRPFSRSEVMNARFRKRNATEPAEAGQGAKANQRNGAVDSELDRAKVHFAEEQFVANFLFGNFKKKIQFYAFLI